MELIIRAEEGAGADLYQWLLSDSDIPRSVTATPAIQDAPGEMGIGFDILNLVIPNAITLGSLVVSIAAFRETRRGRTGAAPQISIGHADTFVMVEDHDGANALRRITENLEAP
jgi:hypothetical protein